ncbi:MAG: SagB/ThcOx family dehydrogenase [Candidatus Omnitrophica bacterium]|nr:SagB/ThcOx family dehydrogenase [Candidatus Omnitrophota bacterium]
MQKKKTFILLGTALLLSAALIFLLKRPQQDKKSTEVLIKLPIPKFQGITLEQAISSRRSQKDYTGRPISVEQLSQLLFAAYGVTGKDFDRPLRSAPSAGAIYPFEIYAAVNNVKEISPGIYKYDGLTHSLKFLRGGEFLREIISASYGQDFMEESSVVLILSVSPDKMIERYGQRGWRYLYMEAGHISENIYLEAVSLGLGSVSVGAFIDEQMDKVLGVDGIKEKVLYLQSVGAINEKRGVNQ